MKFIFFQISCKKLFFEFESKILCVSDRRTYLRTDTVNYRNSLPVLKHMCSLFAFLFAYSVRIISIMGALLLTLSDLTISTPSMVKMGLVKIHQIRALIDVHPPTSHLTGYPQARVKLPSGMQI